MIDVGYDAFDDPYCYKGTGVLKNRAGVARWGGARSFRAEMTSLRSEEPLPDGRFGAAHYRAVHRHLFQDVYPWAGRYRTVRTSNGGNPFCFPEHIAGQMEALFGQLRTDVCLAPPDSASFVSAAAEFLGGLNASMPSAKAMAAANSASCT